MDTGYLAGHQQRFITDRPYQYQPRTINLKIITIEMNPNCWDSSDVTILNGSMKFHCNLQLAKLDLLDLGCRIPSGILRQYVHLLLPPPLPIFCPLCSLFPGLNSEAAQLIKGRHSPGLFGSSSSPLSFRSPTQTGVWNWALPSQCVP